VHVDGARVHNALAEVKASPAEIFKYVDSLTFCLSKGLCSPMGSLVVGDKDFIKQLKMNRKMLGGVVAKPGVFAGPALVAMKTIRL
jgi:threonine aldolase